nr:hypothetical protein [Sinorhizobium fredii]
MLIAIDMSKHRQEVLIGRLEGGLRQRLIEMARKNYYDPLVDELAAIGQPFVVGFEAAATITGPWQFGCSGRASNGDHFANLHIKVEVVRCAEGIWPGEDAL